jgi:hypothetical protein
VDRKKGEKYVIEILQSNEQHFQSNANHRCDCKQEYAYLVARGGAGTGKSRACRETKRMVSDALQTKTLPSHYQYSIFLMMDYSNVDSLSDEEVGNGADVALALRIFLKLFHDMRASKFVQTKVYRFLCKHRLLVLDIVFQAASERLHEYFGLKSEVDIPVILLLDEFQKNKSFFHPLFWRYSIDRIGSYCVDTAGVNEKYNRDHLIVTAMIAGTLSDDLEFDTTDYGKIYFKLPLFKFHSILVILQHCVENNMIPKWAIGPSYYRFWWMMGLIPRTLVFALFALNGLNYDQNRKSIAANDNEILENMYKTTSSMVRYAYTENYQSNDSDDVLLLKLSCTNLGVNCFGRKLYSWINDKKRTGKVFTNTDQNTIFLPQVVFLEMNERERGPFPNLPKFYQFTWEDFESVDLKKITNSFNLLFEEKIEQISIRRFLRAGGSQKTLDLDISINARLYREEVESFISKTPQQEVVYLHLGDVKVRGKEVQKEELLNYVFKTHGGCYLVDGRIWLDEKHLLLIHYNYRLPSEGFEPDRNEVLEWVNDVKGVLEGKYPSYTLIYLYVTTSMIPEKQKDEIRRCWDHVLFVDRSNLECYVPTNLYPYVMTPGKDEAELLNFMEANHIQNDLTQ